MKAIFYISMGATFAILYIKGFFELLYLHIKLITLKNF